MLLISGAADMNTPVALVRAWSEAVEASHSKRIVLFDESGHAPFLTETARLIETLRGFGAEVAEAQGR